MIIYLFFYFTPPFLNFKNRLHVLQVHILYIQFGLVVQFRHTLKENPFNLNILYKIKRSLFPY